MNQPTLKDHAEQNTLLNDNLRGFEIVRAGQQIGMKYRPTVLGVRQAAADCKWLADRHPTAGYELRAIVSVPREAPSDGGALRLGSEAAIAEFGLEADELSEVSCPTTGHDILTTPGYCSECFPQNESPEERIHAQERLAVKSGWVELGGEA